MGTVTTGTGPRRPLGGRAASFAAAALAMSVLTACWPWSAPVGEPATPEPVSTSPAPVDPDLLAVTAQRCGTTEPAPSEPSADFPADLTRSTTLLPDGMTTALGITVSAEADHGEHTVRVEHAQGTVTDADGVVAGVVVALTVPGSHAARTASLSAPVYLTLGSCPDDGAALGDPLPDGRYRLILHGYVEATDHDHAEAEHWVTPALPLEVADGEILPE